MFRCAAGADDCNSVRMATPSRPMSIAGLLACLLLAACATSNIELRPVSNPMPPVSREMRDVSRIMDKPRLIRQSPPKYPRDLRAAGVQGEATITFIVDSEGAVREAMVLKATDYRFGDAALAAVSTWRYLPATVDEHPVPCRMMVPVVFSLNRR